MDVTFVLKRSGLNREMLQANAVVCTFVENIECLSRVFASCFFKIFLNKHIMDVVAFSVIKKMSTCGRTRTLLFPVLSYRRGRGRTCH